MSENEKETTVETVEEKVTVEAVVEPVAKEVEAPKPVEAAPAPEAIVIPEKETEGKGLGSVAGGAIGSTVVKGKKKVEAEEVKPVVKETVALFSQKSYHWVENGGSLKPGYNIVVKARADKWLTLPGVRLATPEEVAKAFEAGK